MLKKFWPILCFGFLCLLTGCGGSDTSRSPNVDAKSSTSQIESKAVKGSDMSESAILADLNTHQEFFDYFGPSAGYVADSLEINQRTTEKDMSDTIYANVTAVNDVSSYTAEFHMHYTYYEQGGWRLDLLEQSGDGTYYISFWPDETDARSVWESNYAERFCDDDDNGAYDYVLDKCETASSGDNYVTFLVTCGSIGHVHTKYEMAQIDFQFMEGQWTHSAAYYPIEPVWKLSDGIEGMFLQTLIDDDGVEDDGIAVFIGNIYYHNSGIYGDWYKYIIYGDQLVIDSQTMLPCTLGLDFLRFYNSSNELVYRDGAGLTCTAVQAPVEYQSKNFNTPLSEEDAKRIIKDLVEEAGFTYWENQEDFWVAKTSDREQETPNQSEPSLDTASIDSSYPYLREFVDLAYSDPSDIAFMQYAMDDYDRWVAGTDYRYIVIDSAGHLTIDYDIAEAEGIAGLW